MKFVLDSERIEDDFIRPYPTPEDLFYSGVVEFSPHSLEKIKKYTHLDNLFQRRK